MMDDLHQHLRALSPGLVLALLAISFSFILGGFFGAAEDSLKGKLRTSAEAVFDTVYAGNDEKKNAVVSKSWTYMKRAHLHGGAIGTAALASIVLLGLLGSPGYRERVSSMAFGAGALIYGLFWMVAGLTAPALGSTGAAKEALGYLAIPGAGLCIIGVVGTLLSVLIRLRR